MKTSLTMVMLVLLLLSILAGCAPGPNPSRKMATEHGELAGFWLGLWHGLIFPLAWIVSLFTDTVAVYAVPNDGGWYNFGYFLGIVVFGVGAKRGHSVVVRH